MKRTLLFFSIFAIGFMMAPSAYAITVDQNVTLVLPSDPTTNYILNNGATFDTLTINNSNFAFAMSAGQSFKLQSGDRKNLTNNGGGTEVCNSNESSVTISVTSSQTVTITPSGTCGSSSTPSISSGGGSTLGTVSSGTSGGGGGVISRTPTPTPSAATTSSPSPSPLVRPTSYPTPYPPLPIVQPPKAPKPVYTFSKGLSLGSQGDAVTALQALLTSYPTVYPEGKITGYFGPLTRAAVQRFQEKYGITSSGGAGYGTVGPKTRQKLNELLGSSSSMPASSPPPASQPMNSLVRGLRIGSRGSDVEALQTFLQTKGFLGADVSITGYYGPLTSAAVGAFQESEGIAMKGDPGYSTVGPKTRAIINQMLGY